MSKLRTNERLHFVVSYGNGNAYIFKAYLVDIALRIESGEIDFKDDVFTTFTEAKKVLLSRIQEDLDSYRMYQRLAKAIKATDVPIETERGEDE